MAGYLLTTIDNPFDPSTDFDSWYAYDTAAGYHTLSYLARVVKSSDELSIADQEQLVDDAIDEIVSENILGLYKKVEIKE